MIRLIPMTQEAFESFMKISLPDQVQGQIQAGHWRAEEADRNIEALFQKMLPDGPATPDHYFFTIEDVSTHTTVGGLWYAVIEGDTKKRQFFVMDIQIYTLYRRRGYGSQAFRAMEEKAREMGITTIALHVFKHNHPARAMYSKLGYVGTDTMLSKDISE
ncbi:MAG: GNAT family N-acetyltransferase [Anaerolineae bacterium]|nr:GNAT family N-acetyltransferase [Anaerolineae bacterium]